MPLEGVTGRPEAPESEPAKLVGNKAIEDVAIAWVMELERRAGRQPVDRRYEAAYPADIDRRWCGSTVHGSGYQARYIETDL